MPTISLPENPAALIEGALAGLRYALSERPSAIVNPVTGDEHAVTYSTDGWSIFANVEARQDAENRAASSVGEELRTRLLAILSSTA